MKAREIKAEVEITKQECEVKTIGNVCGLREVSKLGSKISNEHQTFSYHPRIIRLKKIVYGQFVLHDTILGETRSMLASTYLDFRQVG
jgi:predicted neutral ceramidase superfamily lipid hydrolase